MVTESVLTNWSFINLISLTLYSFFFIFKSKIFIWQKKVWHILLCLLISIRVFSLFFDSRGEFFNSLWRNLVGCCRLRSVVGWVAAQLMCLNTCFMQAAVPLNILLFSNWISFKANFSRWDHSHLKNSSWCQKFQFLLASLHFYVYLQL